jgi:phytoene synthase
MTSAQEITRKAKSNLAFALSCLPRQRKRDMVIFYAFCRVIDDLADDLEVSAATRAGELAAWRHGFEHGFDQPDELQRDMLAVMERYAIPRQPLLDLIDGCSSDLEPQRFASWEDLEKYTYRVASCVGIISIRIFGCTHPDSEKYAITLGHALQLTNILRDVEEDLRKDGRIYLPVDGFSQFGYSEDDLRSHLHNDRFVAMMTSLADRAEALYRETAGYLQPEDAKALKAAEAMRKIYHALLVKMRNDRFHVFTRRYSLSKAKKTSILLATLLGK